MFQLLKNLSLGLALVSSLETAFESAAAGTKPDLTQFATELISMATSEFKLTLPASLTPAEVAALLADVIMLFFPAAA